jgi:hypothetical protein
MTEIHMQRSHILSLCPGLIPFGKYYTEMPEKKWLFDPDTLYWFNQENRSYYRIIETYEEARPIIRRVDSSGNFVASDLRDYEFTLPGDRQPPVSAKIVVHNTKNRTSPVREKMHVAKNVSAVIPDTQPVVIVNQAIEQSTVCRLCDRVFPSVEALMAHEKLSRTHAENLRNRKHS